jgi:hypothetical protein
MRNRYIKGAYKVSKDDLFAILMAAAPMEFLALCVAEQRHQGNNLTLDHLREGMDTLYRQLYVTNFSHSEEIGTEELFSNFIGKCFTSKKKGHKASQCLKKKQKFQIIEQ